MKTPWLGRGITKAVVRVLVDWLRGTRFRTVVVQVHRDHRASAAFATAAGLTPTDRYHDGQARQLEVSGR